MLCCAAGHAAAAVAPRRPLRLRACAPRSLMPLPPHPPYPRSRTCNVLGERCVPADEGGMTHVIVSGGLWPVGGRAGGFAGGALHCPALRGGRAAAACCAPPSIAPPPPPSRAAPQVGCAGHKLTDIIHDQERWLEYAAVRFGYGRVAVDGAASLTFELVSDGALGRRRGWAGQQHGGAPSWCARRPPASQPHALCAGAFLPADGEVHDSVKLHNSRAALRGCSPVAAADGAHEASTAQA